MPILRLRSVALAGVGAVLLTSAAFDCFAQAQRAESHSRWHEAMRTGWVLSTKGKCNEAVSAYAEAFLAAPSEEHKADALLYTAKAYESAYRRTDAIAAYLRLIEEFPTSGHVPEAYFQLGELHRSTSDVPVTAGEEERKRVGAEMVPAKAIPYFEGAVRTGAEYDLYVLSSKMYLVALYFEIGRDPDGWTILHELACIDVCDVKSPAYRGPFADIRTKDETMDQRIEEARRNAATTRSTARGRLVECSIVPGDPVQSIANLEKLASQYIGTDVEQSARNRIEAISRQLQEEVRQELQPVSEDSDATSSQEPAT